MDRFPVEGIGARAPLVSETLLLAVACLGYVILVAFALALLRITSHAERAAMRQRRELWADAQAPDRRRHRSAV
jgi:hypothetical protein